MLPQAQSGSAARDVAAVMHGRTLNELRDAPLACPHMATVLSHLRITHTLTPLHTTTPNTNTTRDMLDTTPGRSSCIDHTVFPHILDHIIEVSDPADLHQLRATSRAFRERIDSLYYDHLAVYTTSRRGSLPELPEVDEYGACGEYCVKINVVELDSPSSSSSLPKLAVAEVPSSPKSVRSSISTSTRPQLRDVHGRRIPGLCWEDEDATLAERETMINHLATVRVLDYHSRVDLATVDAEMAEALTGLQVVRRFEPTAPVLPAPKIIDFAFLTPHQGSHAHADSSISRSPCECPSAFTFDVPAGAKTSVTNVFYSPRRVPMHSFLQLGYCPDNSHAVIKYIPRPDRTGCAPTPSCVGCKLPKLGMLHHLIEELAFRVPSVTHTLVGMDEIDRALLGLPPNTTNEEMQQHLVAAVQEECSILFPQEVAMRVPDTITFLTLAEYQAQMSPVEYALETEQ
jgi:hypothetical protein